MKKIKVIDLLNMIANGEKPPKRIKGVLNTGYEDIYYYCLDNYNTSGKNGKNITLFDRYNFLVLNDYVEIMEEPILMDKEEEYLSTVIKPFRDIVCSITKLNFDSDKEYIEIKCIDDDSNYYIELPPFQENTMYKGIELDKVYTPEELGL